MIVFEYFLRIIVHDNYRIIDVDKYGIKIKVINISLLIIIPTLTIKLTLLLFFNLKFFMEICSNYYRVLY